MLFEVAVRVGVLAGAVALTACAGIAPAGRNASGAEAPLGPPPASAASEAAPDTPPPRLPPVAAPNVSVAPTPAPPRRASGEDEIVVPGQVQRQIPPPNGDPRSRAERIEDIRAWDQCVTSVQAAFESDPMRPQLQSPEEVCRTSLGMAARDGVPESRQRP